MTNGQMIRILRAAEAVKIENIRNLNHRIRQIRSGQAPTDTDASKKARNEFELACRAYLEEIEN